MSGFCTGRTYQSVQHLSVRDRQSNMHLPGMSRNGEWCERKNKSHNVGWTDFYLGHIPRPHSVGSWRHDTISLIYCHVSLTTGTHKDSIDLAVCHTISVFWATWFSYHIMANWPYNKKKEKSIYILAKAMISHLFNDFNRRNGFSGVCVWGEGGGWGSLSGVLVVWRQSGLKSNTLHTWVEIATTPMGAC